MFYLIGAGLSVGHLTKETLSVLKSSKKVFFDSYTNVFEKKQLSAIEKACGKRIELLGRSQIEEQFAGVLKEAKKSSIALVVSGNPLTATTHVQLLLDAKKLGIPFRVLPGISITSFLPFSGLDSYRFGRIATIVAPKPNFAPDSFFGVIEKNHSMNLHSLCLLEIDAEKNFFLSVPVALSVLEKTADKKNASFLKKSFIVSFFAVGTEKQRIVFGSFSRMKNFSFPVFPQCFVVCSALNEKEKEALGVLCEHA